MIEAPPMPLAGAPASASAPAPTRTAVSPTPPAKPEIKVSEMAKPAADNRPGVKKTSARDSVMAELRKKSVPETEKQEGERDAKEVQISEGMGDEPDAADGGADNKEAGAEPAGKPAAGESEKKKEKVSPWKLVEEYKQRLAKVEQEKLDAEKRAIPEEKWKQTTETLAQKEKRLAELEEEIKYVNFKKSDTYQKMQAEYEGAWNKAMESLSDLMVQGEDGSERQMTPEDMLQLVNSKDVPAMQMAIEQYGDLAQLVMQHRDKIKNLFDQQAKAEETARAQGTERSKKQQEEFGQMSKTIIDTWSKANDEIKADEKFGKYFTPVDGDENINQRLAKGFELADRAFSENPRNPSLTPEQRAAIVKRHAAIRNRSAAFGRLVYENTQKDARIAELQKQLDEYKGGEPETRGSSAAAARTGKVSAMESALAELRKRAK